jgi:hypothetical protein
MYLPSLLLVYHYVYVALLFVPLFEVFLLCGCKCQARLCALCRCQRTFANIRPEALMCKVLPRSTSEYNIENKFQLMRIRDIRHGVEFSWVDGYHSPYLNSSSELANDRQRKCNETR